jgi:hypothetical protein
LVVVVTAVGAHYVDPENARKWEPVMAFVTFEEDESRDKLVARAAASEGGVLTLAGVPCKVTVAPEPETIQYEHLGYGPKQRGCRKAIIGFSTILMLAIGFWMIMEARVFKDAMAYVDQCQWIMGPDRSTNASKAFADGMEKACPNALQRSNTDSSESGISYPEVYKSAYLEMQEILGASFPRISHTEDSTLPLGRKCDSW